MSREPMPGESQAAQLRREFDGRFAAPRAKEVVQRVSLLTIRVGGDPFAVRLGEIQGVFCDRTIAPVPGPLAELLGVAAFRGSVVPVYDLRRFLGYEAGGSPRWMIVAAGAPVALAFDVLERYLSAPSHAVVEHGGSGREHLRGALQAEGLTRLCVDVPSIVTAIRSRARSQGGQTGV